MDLKFFHFNNDHVVFDMNRVCLFIVDEMAYRALKGSPIASISSEVASEMEQLREWGCFQPEPAFEETEPAPVNIKPHINSITLGLTHRCNLQCSYCFGQRYLTDVDEDDQEILEVGQACLDLLHDNCTADLSGEEHYSLIFFGGEPLLKFDLLKQLVRYGKQLFGDEENRLTWGVTTNATLLDTERAAFLRNDGINPLISIDGCQQAHDYYRKYPTGRGSFDVIQHNLLQARDLGLPFGARVTLTNKNVDLVNLMKELDELGFFSHKFSPICGEDQYALTVNSKQALRQSYSKLADIFIARLKRREPITFDLFDPYLDALFFSKGSPWCCDAGYRSVNVSPTGDVFSCYKLVGEPEACVGDIRDREIIARRPGCDYADRVEQIAECRHCWIRHLCGGGCFADRYLSHKFNQHQSLKNHCDLSRFLVYQAIRIMYHFSKEERHLLQEYLKRKEV